MARVDETKPLISGLSESATEDARNSDSENRGIGRSPPTANDKQRVLIGVPSVKVNAPAHACFVFPCQQSKTMENIEKKGCCARAIPNDRRDAKYWETKVDDPMKKAEKLFKQPQLHCKLFFGIFEDEEPRAGDEEQGADAEIDGAEEEREERNRAKKVFMQDHDNQKFLNAARNDFHEDITFGQYSEMFRNLFVNFLQEPELCGFDLLATKSVDEDEVFLQVFLHDRKISITMDKKEEKHKDASVNDDLSATPMPRAQTNKAHEPTLADVIGADLKMLVSVRDEWWPKACVMLKDQTLEPRRDFTRGKGLVYPAHTICDLNLVIKYGDVYDPWTETDKIRMVYGKILEIFDIDEMVSQGLISMHFPQHDFSTVTELMEVLPCGLNSGKHHTCGHSVRLVPSHTESRFLGLWQYGEPDVWDDKMRQYLGEEVGFYWNFIATYTRFLVIPAALGVVMIFREELRKHPVKTWLLTPAFFRDIHIIPEDNENFTDEWMFIDLKGGDLVRIAQILNALIVAVWAAWFAQSFVRCEQEKLARWGMQIKGAAAVTANPDYDPSSARGFWDDWYYRKHKGDLVKVKDYVTWPKVKGFAKQRVARFCGNLGVILFFMFIVLSIGKVMRMRKDMVDEPRDWRWMSQLFHAIAGPLPVVGIGMAANSTVQRDEVQWVGREGGALLITFEIKLLDFIWDLFVRWVVEKENHRSVQHKNESLAVKLFAVKVFNWSYPYLYIAFLKAHYEGCAKNKDGEEDCIPELQYSLGVFFASSAAIDVMIMGVKWMMAFLRVRNELRVVQIGAKESGAEAADYTYLQVQAKLDPPDLVLDELTVFMANFAFTCAFTIACPFIPVFAFFYNAFMCRLYMWKRLRVSKRNYPTSSAGIGVWVSLMKISVILSCVVNPMIAVFSMAPIKNFRKVNKGIFFMIIEHLLLLLIGMVFVLTNDTPEEATRFEEYNSEKLPRLLNPKQTRKWRIDHEATRDATSEAGKKNETAAPVFGKDIRPDCFIDEKCELKQA